MKALFETLRQVLPVTPNLRTVGAVRTFLSNILRTRVFNSYSPRGPLFVTWLVTFDCNVHCKFCSTHQLKKEFPEKITRERALELAHQIGRSGTWVCGFTGGEVLIWPHLFEVVKILKSYGVHVYIVSNGLTLEENVDAILETGVDYVVVSLEASNAEEHNFIRKSLIREKRDVFEAAIEGIEALKSKRKGDSPKIKSSTVFSPESLPRIQKTLKELEELVDVSSFQPITSHPPFSPHQPDEKYLEVFTWQERQKKEAESAIQDIIKNFPQFNTSYFNKIPDFWFEPEKLKCQIRCWSPSLRLLIHPDGQAFQCTENPRFAAVGNVIEQDILEVWNSEEMKRQREEIRQHKNGCICWTQSTAFNAFMEDVPLSKKLPILNKKEVQRVE